MKTPTDLELLNQIYDRYYTVFAGENGAVPQRESKIFVPIDCDTVAKALGVDGDIVFGRLYYDLDNRYGYKQQDGGNLSQLQ